MNTAAETRTCFFNNSALNEVLDNLALQDAVLL
jgi:hypothetical protein